MTVQFSVEGGSIPGLNLVELCVWDWTFFIPDGPEKLAIQTALDLELETWRQRQYHARDPHVLPIRTLRGNLEQVLSGSST